MGGGGDFGGVGTDMTCPFILIGRKWVRAKDAKDAKAAKLRKAITELALDHPSWRACGWRGLPGSVSPATTEAAGGVSGLGEGRFGGD